MTCPGVPFPQKMSEQSRTSISLPRNPEFPESDSPKSLKSKTAGGRKTFKTPLADALYVINYREAINKSSLSLPQWLCRSFPSYRTVNYFTFSTLSPTSSSSSMASHFFLQLPKSFYLKSFGSKSKRCKAGVPKINLNGKKPGNSLLLKNSGSLGLFFAYCTSSHCFSLGA
ncbi:hypothetical protein MANES_04G131766v8 [Manihot esculenta]|uniref:Uncharacterized protein n=1 Tax=Manihot esculenta TaxID=3983 RepID=A0ACB7HUU7_MANES|nr:hypothetical protein MANES_04G131766v8 [Manihot esculenta]